MINDKPTIWDDGSDITKLNQLFDDLTTRPFASPQVAMDTIRAALDLHGIILPKLDNEQSIDGPSMLSSLGRLHAGLNPLQVNTDCEYAFKITDADDDGPDWDSDLHLYICIDRDEESGHYDAYAQVVDKSDLDMLLNMDIPEIEHEYPEMFGDAAGETDYIRTQRHTQQTGFKSGEK